MRIKKILFPTDLSTHSLMRGMSCALSLARDHDAELVLFHVTSFPAPPLSCVRETDTASPSRRIFLPPTVDQILQKTHASVTHFVTARLNRELDGIRWRIRVSLGTVGKEIVAAALVEQVDLVVMSRTDRGILVRLFLQSIAEQVSRNAPCPVLSVRPPRMAGVPQGKPLARYESSFARQRSIAFTRRLQAAMRVKAGNQRFICYGV